MKTGNDEGIRQLLKLFCHSRAYQAQSLSPDYMVVRTGETLTPQQSCTLSEWSQRLLFVAAGPSTAAIEIVDQDDDGHANRMEVLILGAIVELVLVSCRRISVSSSIVSHLLCVAGQ